MGRDKAAYMQSVRRHGDITLNTNTDLETQKKFQEALSPALQKAVETELDNLKGCLDGEVAVDAVSHHYKFVDLEPAA